MPPFQEAAAAAKANPTGPPADGPAFLQGQNPEDAAPQGNPIDALDSRVTALEETITRVAAAVAEMSGGGGGAPPGAAPPPGPPLPA